MKNDEADDMLGPMYPALCADGTLVLKELGLPADAAILDVGTGKGLFAIFLASQGHRVVTGEPATDTSRYAGRDWAARAEKVGVRDRIRFEAFDAGAMPFAAGTFDAVFFFGVLHHIDESARAGVFGEALRVAKKDGSVVFFEPREETLRMIRVDDREHPPAAEPSRYLKGRSIAEKRIEGTLMDAFIFRKAG